MPYTVQLSKTDTVTLDQPYGHPVELEDKRKYSAHVLLSPINERIQIYDFDVKDYDAFAARLRELCALNNYGKVFVRAPEQFAADLEHVGFVREAPIPGYFDGNDAIVMSLFAREDRLEQPRKAEEDEIAEKATEGELPKGTPQKVLPEGYTVDFFKDTDAEDLAALYEEVFPSYPYPITDPAYLRRTAEENIIYRLIRNGDGKLVAAASAETNPKFYNSEMTDFAVRESERGHGLAQFLLPMLERDAIRKFNIRHFYTIARACNYGMIRTFHKCGYVLTGTLVNNCSIAGRFENMHVMVKVQTDPGTR